MSKISEKRRQDILTAAFETFFDKGVEAASMSEIARRAEIGKSTIYEYFPSKNELLMETYTWLLRNISQRVRAVFAREEDDLRTQLCRYVETVIGDVRSVKCGDLVAKNMLQFTAAWGTDLLKKDVETFRCMVVEAITQALFRAKERGEVPSGVDPASAALLLWVLLNPMPISYLYGAGVERPVERAVDTVLYGLYAAQGVQNQLQ